jgi:DNA-binding transcriptional LysR family regulator
MLDALETLGLLAELGTMGKVATRLRVTQSAVSKRVAALEHALGGRLIEREGRRVRLTPKALELVGRAQPLLAELRGALAGEQHLSHGRIVLGVSESILTSWGPLALAEAQRAHPDVELSLHTHRSPVALDGVASGELHLALVAGHSERGVGLLAEHVLDEEMVLLGLRSGATPRTTLRTRGEPLSVLSIERSSGTHRALEPQLRALRAKGIDLSVDRELQSYAAIVQLARAGLGPALVPLPLARALGAGRAELTRLPSPGLHRPVVLVARKTTWARALIARFAGTLRQAAQLAAKKGTPRVSG